MSKSDFQWEFVQCKAILVMYARLRGYKLTDGRGYASEAANAADGGHPSSTHLHRLAQDFNLFINDDRVERYVTGDSVAWQDLGKFWKSLHERARWGGDWGDFNHFSFEWHGVK